MAIPKEPLTTIDNTKSPDLDFLEKVDGTISNNIPSNNIEQSSNDLQKIEDQDNPILSDNTNTDEEYIQVASIFPKKIPKLKEKVTLKDKPYGENFEEIRQKQQEAFGTKTEGEDFVFEPGTGNIIFGQFDDSQLKIIEDTMNDLQLGKLDQVKGSLQTTLRDLTLLDTGQFQDAVATIFKESIDKAKRGKIKVEDIAAQAAKLGRNEVYLKIFKRKPGEILDLTTTYRAILETQLLRIETEKLSKVVLSGNATEKQVQNFYQVLRLYGAVNSQVAGSISETGRTLGVVSKLPSPTEEGAVDIIKILEEEMGADLSTEGAQKIASAFLSLKPHQQSKFAKDTFGKKMRDAWAEIWVNSKLASPITHVVNMAGNFTFNTLRVAEYGIAATLNKIPGLSSKEGIMFNEVFQMIKSIKYGTKLGMVNAYEAFKTGDAATTKLDLRKPNAVGKRLLPEKYQNTFMGSALEMFGTYSRIPGKFLVAEDEFVKGVLYQMELERLATRKFNQAIGDGLSEDDAQKIFIKTVADPDSTTVKEAQDAALEGTFQKDLPPGVFSKAQDFFNIPEMKLFVPFYKTIMNIFMESNKRNPFMMGAGSLLPTELGSKIRGDLMGKNGKATQQLALAKLSTGSTLMYTFGTMAYGGSGFDQDFMITGMAPMNKAEREAFFRKGLQPYSIALLDKETGLYKSTSYARFDPISSLLAISADMAYMASRPDQYADPNFVNSMTAMFGNGLAAIFPYLTEQPFLTGIQELGRLFQPGYGDAEGMVERALTILTEKITEGGLAVVPGVSTFGGYLQRMQDPTIYDTNITSDQAEWFRNNFDGDIPAPIRAFYKAYNKAMKDSPFFNTDLKPRINLWGEDMVGPEQGMFSPVRVVNEKYNDVDEFLVKAGLGIPMPKNNIGGIPMAQDEYYDYIKFINIDDDGDGESDLLQELQSLVNDPDFLSLLPGEQLEEMNSVVTQYKQTGKDLFLLNNPSFNAKVEGLKEKIKVRGRR
jgi:hypothetical protein